MNNEESSANINTQPSMYKNKDIKPALNIPPLNLNSPDLRQFPLNCLCYIKIKICISNCQKEVKPFKSIYGSGVMIDKHLVLTVAHNVCERQSLKQQLQNLKKQHLDKSYVKLALLNGQNEGIFSIEDIKISKNYTKSSKLSEGDYYDYALLQIKPKDQKAAQIQRQQFPIPLAIQNLLSYNTMNLSIWGYPIQANIMNTPKQNHNNSSILMANPAGGDGQLKVKSRDDRYLYYQIKTDKGTSGAPIFTKLFDKDVFIGLHKASKNSKSQNNIPQNVSNSISQIYSNFGINNMNAIKQVNQWGYQLFRKPLIYTPATIGLHKDPSRITKFQLIFYLDKGITLIDLYVITSYDLSSIRKIMISGNKIGDEGFICLTKRKLPALESLYIAQNFLMDLGKVQDQNWENIANIKILALNINKIKEFPEKIMKLQNLNLLWLSYNNISNISEAFVKFCKSSKNEIVIHMYQNRIPIQNLPMKTSIKAIEQTKAICYWQKIQVKK